jgi:hypothetical protein
MTKKELRIIWEVLNKIDNKDFKVRESIALVDRDIARADRYFQKRLEQTQYKMKPNVD